MDTQNPTPGDYIDILKRRKWSMMLPALFVFLATGLVAFLLPSVYKSTATILIEDQEIPQDFVMATVTGFAEQRIQSINQRIMSTSRLMEIIREFGLYNDLKDRWTTEEIIEKMREEIRLDTISTEVMDRRTGRPTVATIAFTLSYEGKDPSKVQKVADRLTSLYLEENLKVRARQTEDTYTFLEDELNRVQQELSKKEKAIAEFKEGHINTLPELIQVNMQSLNNIERSQERMEEQLRGLKEREGYLQTQLSITDTDPIQKSEDERRLEVLEVQLVALKTKYSDVFPDVIKTTQEIGKLREKIESDQTDSDAKGAPPENPAYVQIASQLSAVQADMGTVQRQIAELAQRAALYRLRIEQTPRVEEQYNDLVSQRNNMRAKTNDLMQKLMEARVAHGLEKGQKGERFTLIDPARFPERPFKPNRLAILLIGIVLGTGAGVGFGALREFTDHSVRKPEALALATGIPVLASIPEIVTAKDRRRKWIRRALWAVSIMALVAGGIAFFHFFVMDLDVFWAKLMRKLDHIFVF